MPGGFLSFEPQRGVRDAAGARGFGTGHDSTIQVLWMRLAEDLAEDVSDRAIQYILPSHHSVAIS